MRRSRVIAILMASGPLLTDAGRAHPAQFTTLQVEIEPGGEFHASLNIDILAYALGETSLQSTNEELQALLDGPRADLKAKLADAGERFRREVVIHTDAGNVVPSSWTLPGMTDVDEVLARNIHPRILMPGDIEFSGMLPADAHTLSIRLPYILGDTMDVYELPNGDSIAAPVAAGEYSEEVHPDLAPSAAPPAANLPEKSGTRSHLIKEVLGGVLFLAALFLINTRLLPFLRKALHQR